MTRESVRQWKRVIRGELEGEGHPSGMPGSEAAMSLLERSIRFGHSRLAVLRLAAAVQAGAAPTEQHWRYCSEAALRSKDRALQALLEQAGSYRAHQQKEPPPRHQERAPEPGHGRFAESCG